jgi:hypothetical protein
MITEYAVVEKQKINRNPKNYHPVKVTALNYIREALEEERYEEVRDMIAIAREFGAGHWDIRIAMVPGFTRKP